MFWILISSIESVYVSATKCSFFFIKENTDFKLFSTEHLNSTLYSLSNSQPNLILPLCLSFHIPFLVHLFSVVLCFTRHSGSCEPTALSCCWADWLFWLRLHWCLAAWHKQRERAKRIEEKHTVTILASEI